MTEVSTDVKLGLEIHIQLRTKTKLFCSCEVSYGAPPNSRVCPVCLGLPGALPILNQQALTLSIRMALALGCRLPEVTKWDRKNYYYPDLPKNYQISQLDQPVGTAGTFEYALGQSTRCVRIRRAHLEEDAGKNLHEHPQSSYIDLNRAGTPLLEVVTEPDLQGADDAYAFCTEFHRLAVHLGVSDGVMQKGQLRFEPNINVHIRQAGTTYITPICEVKNLNSFRAIRGAVAYEIERQCTTWQSDPTYTLERHGKENRGWDDVNMKTVFQRGKEEAHDYRYFPDPDIIAVQLNAEHIERERQQLPERPFARRSRLQRDYGLSSEDATLITEDRATAELFDNAIAHGASASTLCKHFIGFWSRFANDRDVTIADLGVRAQRMAELAQLQDEARISASAAATIAQIMLADEDAPAMIAKSEGLEMIQDRSALEAMVKQAMADHPQAVEIIRNGGKKREKSLGFLVGQVMQRSKGSAAPKVVRQLLDDALGS